MLKKLLGNKNEFYLQIDESQGAAPETPAPVAESAAIPETPAPAAKKTSIKKAKSTPAAEAKPAAAPVVAPQPKAPVSPAQVAFASADPIPQNIARRMPGPSLNKFKEIARQVKKR